MRFAANYSRPLADLVDQGQVAVDLYKLPAWPDLVADLAPAPRYVHFPLLAGTGSHGPINTETNAPPDWAQVDALLEATQTPWVSAHLGPRPEDHPDLVHATPVEQAEGIAAAMIADLRSLVARYGTDRVVGENITEFFGMHLRAAMLPEVIGRVIETVGCGFLLDVSHARLAARALDLDPRAYIEALPLQHIREVHITGIQRFDAFWAGRLASAGVEARVIEQLADQEIDHLPMTGEDWAFTEWALGQIRVGAWREPEIVAFEVGGIGPMFEAMTIPEALGAQVPRLYAMVHGGGK
jgi:uncharacterized protein